MRNARRRWQTNICRRRHHFHNLGSQAYLCYKMQYLLPRFLLIVFLFQVLTPHTWKEEIAHLPGLIQHFNEHKLEEPDLSLVDFLSLHYGSAYANHKSEHNHSKLPGKDHQDHAQCTMSVLDFAPALLQLLPLNLSASFEYTDVFSAHRVFTSTYFHAIWQPPKSFLQIELIA